MRRLILTLSLLAAQAAPACDCFSPVQRLKASEDALSKARVAVFGRVVKVSDSGSAEVLVLETFKGPPVGATLEARQDFGLCKGQGFALGEETLVLSFGPAPTACDKLPADNFLLEGFRTITKPK